MKLRLALAVLLAPLALAGCSGVMAFGGGGTGGGAVTAPAGNGAELAAVQPGGAAPGAGTMTSGLVSGDIGAALDGRDRQAALAAEYRALELGSAGSPVAWTGTAGRAGEVVPGPAYRVNEYACRDYTHTVTVNGQASAARGTACREPDGTWRPVT